MPDRRTDLHRALLSLRAAEEVDAFLEDILTPREREELELRLDIARRLQHGETYGQIESLTGASSTTISRVRRCLMYGRGGYRTVLERLAGPQEG